MIFRRILTLCGILQKLLLIRLSLGSNTGSVVYVSFDKILKSTTDCTLPLSFDIEINFRNGTILYLSLSRRAGYSEANKPLYVVRKADDGTNFLQNQQLSIIKDLALYQDIPNGAAIELRCFESKTGNNKMQLTGTFVREEREFTLTKAPDELQRETGQNTQAYLVTERPTPTGLNHDYRLPPGGRDVRKREDFSLQRRSRRSVVIHQPYVVDILLLIDFQIYSDWYKRIQGATHTEKDQNVKNELRRYFSHFMNEVDLRYKSFNRSDLQFDMNIAGFIVADTPDAYPAMELRKEPASPRDYVNADYALRDFRTWIKMTNELPLHDHAMLLTGVDLYSLDEKNSRRLLHTAGLAFIGSMCRTNGDSTSVVEDHGGFQNTGTAAHEIGHSLGALHDGEKNRCDSSQRYIMASSGYGPIPPELRLNQWRFSNCTLDYFSEFVYNLSRLGYTCLTESYHDVSMPIKEMSGQLYGPDEQCRLIWGPSSYMCRGAEFGNASTLCSAMYCRDPSTDSDCVLHFAARGTSCGNKKWCIDGVCTFDTKAPEKTDHCLLGDQPGIAFIGQNCENLVNNVTAYCYQDKVLARCCQSCAKHYTWKLGCEYGDRVKGCLQSHCRLIDKDPSIRSDCCGTCNIGETITTTTPAPYTLQTEDRGVSAPDDANDCLDKAHVNEYSCYDFIMTNGRHLCYDDILERYCCKTCSKLTNVEIPGCKYGDRKPSVCSSQRNVTLSWCQKYEQDCCMTCVPILTGTSSALQWTLDIFLFILGLYIFIL